MSRRALSTALLAVLLVGVVALLAVVAAPAPGAVDTDPSSRSAGRAGTLALHDWLRDLGLATSRLSGDFQPSDSDVLVVADPEQTFSDDEVNRTVGFVQDGGVLLLAVDAAHVEAASPLLDRLAVHIRGVVAADAAVPAQPLGGGAPVQRVDMGGSALDLGGSGAPLLLSGEVPVAVGIGLGSGHVFVIGSEYPLSNEGLRPSRPDSSGHLVPTGSDADRLLLALTLQGRVGSGDVLRIGFDEVHHGEGASGGASAIFVGPVGLALVLAAVVVVVALALQGRRLGRAVPAGDAARVPTAGDLVTAVAELYRRSGRRGPVAACYAAELKERVGAATGLEPGLDDAAFCAALRPWGEEPAARVAEVLAQARVLEAGVPGEDDLVTLARAVDAVESRWTVGARR